MRENLIMACIIIMFIIGYFIFTSKLNKDAFINTNMLNTRGHILVTEDNILTRLDNSVKKLHDTFFFN